MDKRIILIDDNEIDLFINKRILELTGIKEPISDFLSPVEALEFLNSQRDNSNLEVVILLDLCMPEMDGLSFLSAFGQMQGPVRKNTRVFVLSSSTSQNDIKNALSYPIVKKFIVKPLTISKADAIFNRQAANSVIN